MPKIMDRKLEAIILSDVPTTDWVKRGRTLLESKGSTATIMFDSATWQEDLRAKLPTADLLLVAPWTTPAIFMSEGLLDRAPRLRVIVGTFDNRFTSLVSIEALQRHNIRSINISRSMTPSVAEVALAQTLNLLRDVPAAVALMRAAVWRRTTWDTFGYIYGDLADKKVGLAGYGRIDRRYHELLGGFGCPIVVYDPMLNKAAAQKLGLTYTSSLVELAAAFEIFVVGIAPLKSSLRHVTKAVFDAGIFVLVSPWRWSMSLHRGARSTHASCARQSMYSRSSQLRPTRTTGFIRTSCRRRALQKRPSIATSAASATPASRRSPLWKAASYDSRHPRLMHRCTAASIGSGGKTVVPVMQRTRMVCVAVDDHQSSEAF